MIVPQPLVLRYDQLALIFSGCEVLGFKGPFEQSQELEVGDATDAHVREPKLGVWTWELHDNAGFQSEALSFVVSGRIASFPPQPSLLLFLFPILQSSSHCLLLLLLFYLFAQLHCPRKSLSTVRIASECTKQAMAISVCLVRRSYDVWKFTNNGCVGLGPCVCVWVLSAGVCELWAAARTMALAVALAAA